MIFELNELLKMVDQWKFELHRKLKKMTPKQRAAFWKQSHEEARSLGLNVADVDNTPRPKTKRKQRATG